MLNRLFAPVGFDLDGYDSTSRNGTGCGRLDVEGGVDRNFIVFVSSLRELGAEPYWEMANEAIEAGELRFEVVVRDYDEQSNDDCVWSRFELNGNAIHDFVPAVVVDETLEVSGGSYPFWMPVRSWSSSS